MACSPETDWWVLPVSGMVAELAPDEEPEGEKSRRGRRYETPGKYSPFLQRYLGRVMSTA